MVTDRGFLIGATKPRVLAQFWRLYRRMPDRVFPVGSTWRAGPVGDESAQRGRLGAGRDFGDAPNATHDEPTHVDCTTGGER